MVGRLQNSLVEVMVVVGMDQDTGLRPAFPQPNQSDPRKGALLSTAFEPQVLAAISQQVALFPCSDLHGNQDLNYPPRDIPPAMGIKRNRLRRRAGRKTSFTAMDLLMRSKKSSVLVHPTELPVQQDVVNSLATLCFPDSAYVYDEVPEESVHFLVLTDITGCRTFATCITFTRPYIVQQGHEPGSWSCILCPRTNDLQLTEGECLCYIPMCCVLISKYPYYNLMKDCLSRLVMKIKQDYEETKTFLKEFALQLTMTPVPPAGKLAISFNLDTVFLTIPPPGYPDRRVVDIHLNLVFLCFNIDSIIEIITCILTQQRIVFVSENYALLTVVSESFLHFILPFNWNHTYVPLLSTKLLELIDAPGSFLMGCHADHRDQVEQVQGIVMVDIDRGVVQVCETISLPSMPKAPADMLKQVLQQARQHFELAQLARPSPFTFEQSHLLRESFQDQFHQEILTAFLEFMVNLFRDVMQHIKVERRFFNRENFLKSQEVQDRPFYEEVLTTDMFSRFLKDRLNQKHDYWTMLEERTRPVLRNSLGILNDKSEWIRPTTTLPRKASTCFALSGLRRPEIVTFQLPFFVPELSHHYFEKCISELAEAIEESKTASLRASYLFLRGMLYIAGSHVLEGMEDFHQLSAYDTRLFPRQSISEVLNGLQHDDKERLQTSSFYKKSELWRELSVKRNSMVDQPVVMEMDKIPKKSVDLTGFAEHVQLLEIVADPDTITRLFHALTMGRRPVLDTGTFEMFYQCWKEIEVECREVRLPDRDHNPGECVLKVSAMIKSDFGMGRLILTQKRLYFLQEGSRQFREIIKLRELERVDKITQMSFLVPVEALRFVKLGGNKKDLFVASLKEERNWWQMLITEMWSGKLIAEELRDPGIIQQAAQNVLLADALIRSGVEDESTTQSAVEHGVAKLCFFSSRRAEGCDTLPSETKDVLQHRINPNAREVDKQAVEALLYTPGNRSTDGEASGPKLWCGMGNGKLRIFDASTWILEQQYIEAKERIVCLLAVGNVQVWAGSFDCIIYVIDSRTKMCNQTLMEHSDMVSTLTASDDERTVYSGSLNGHIIAWDVETLQSGKQILLEGVRSLISMQYKDGHLWCCTRELLLVLKPDGTVVRRLQFEDQHNSIVQIDCFLVTSIDEVWTGCGRQGEIITWTADTFTRKVTMQVPCRGVSKMVSVQDKVWVGTKQGKIYIYDARTHKQEKELQAHNDAIRSMCTAQNRYVMSAAGSTDGKVAIWRASTF